MTALLLACGAQALRRDRDVGTRPARDNRYQGMMPFTIPLMRNTNRSRTCERATRRPDGARFSSIFNLIRHRARLAMALITATCHSMGQSSVKQGNNGPAAIRARPWLTKVSAFGCEEHVTLSY